METKTYKSNKAIKAGISVFTTLGIIFALFVVITNIPLIPIMENGQIKSWHSLTLPALGDIVPAAGASGIVNVSVVKYNLFDYTQNITRNGSMYAWSGVGGEANNTEIGVNVPYDINLAIVAKVRWNRTHAKNSTSNVWMANWVRGNLTIPNFGLQNHTMAEYNISSALWESTQDFVYYYYVYNGTTGFSINRSQRVPVCYFRFWAYY
jgi:hypothetical protein